MNDEEKTRITVEIYGMQYKLMGNSSSGYMKKIADHVNDQMVKIAKGRPRLDIPHLAILVAVNAVDDYFKMKEQMDKQQNDGEKAALIAQLEKLQTEERKHESARKAELERLQAEYQAEIEQLQAEHKQDLDQLRAQNKLATQQLQSNVQKDMGLQEEYIKLKEEYAKLQSEYNEWIQLVELNNPGSD